MQKAAEESAAFLVTQFQMAQIIRGRECALSFVDGLAVQATSTGFFVSKISGDQVVRTPASADVDPGSGGTYQIAVGIERVQKTRLIGASIRLDSPQCVFVDEK
jgi:hypothetical protein